MSVRAPPSDLQYNNALQVGPEVGSCLWTQACKLCQPFRTCEFDILGSLSQTVVCVCAVCVCVCVCVCAHVGVHVHEVFTEGLSQRGLLYHRTVKSLNMTFQFIKVFQPPAPRNFSLATFPPRFRSPVSLLRVTFPSSPLSLTFLPVHTSGSHSPQLFMLNGLAVTQHPLCVPYSESISLSFSHLVYCNIFFEVPLGIKQVRGS